MLHACTTEGCATIVFGRGPCVEHDPRRAQLADHLLAEAVAAVQHEQEPAEATASPARAAGVGSEFADEFPQQGSSGLR